MIEIVEKHAVELLQELKEVERKNKELTTIDETILRKVVTI